MLSAEIIAIGSELLTPDKSDTNSLWLTGELNAIGIDVKLKTIVGDDKARLIETLSDALRRSDIVLTTGGLGPTEDDITRVCTAAAVGRDLVYLEAIESSLRERFRLWGREMPDINKRQAFVIDGCEVLPNPNGSAVGMLLKEESKLLIILPGPPRENQPMFRDHALRELAKVSGSVVSRRRLIRVSGMGESAVDEIAAPIYQKYGGVETSILFNKSEVEIHVSSRSASEAEAQSAVDKAAEELISALGKNVFSTDGAEMEEVVGRRLTKLNQTVAIAESCTGGLIAHRLTEVPGSSAYFLEGAVTYSNAAKVRVLGVCPEILAIHGAVSAECAVAMAEGLKTIAGSDHALSVTGIAGPGGGTEEKPVGTVFVGYSGPLGTKTLKLMLPGDRYLIRWRASQAALDLFRRQLEKL